MKKMNQIYYLWLFTLIILSCQNQKNNNQLEETNPHSFDGKWLPISKENDSNFFIKEQKLNRVKNIICDSIVDSCELTTISKEYSFHIKANEYNDIKVQQYPISAWISIISKKGKTQEIYFEPNSWSIYKKLPCHKFFVKDFNFDGLEDLAIVWDNSANGDELYEYYFQGKDGIFSVLESFPLQHGLLAEDIDSTNKTIKTTSVVGCCNYNINIYKMKSEGNWEITTSQEKIN